ncbi:MAG: NADH-quinone oxidoreductase subunit NuoE [Candidatus Omnitrophota bacterium]
MLQKIEINEIEQEVTYYQNKQAVGIEALKIVQRHRGWISDEAIHDIGDYLGLDPAEVENIATFYNLIFRKPVGKHIILVCDSISCWILGSETLLDYLCRKLEITPGQTTADGMFTLLPTACLGVCEKAPVMMIDQTLHTDLTVERIDEILNDVQGLNRG